MRNVAINQAESIFETFWDGGESYPGNEKYSSLCNYRFDYGKNVGAEIVQIWSGVNIKIWNQPEGETVAMERDCRLNITGYDTFRLFAAVPEAFNIKIICVIDGKKQEVMQFNGNNSTGEYDGGISGNEITNIRVEFTHTGNTAALSTFYWFGLSNMEQQKIMESRKSPYDENWEGCFKEDYEINPSIGIYFNNEELTQIRKKVKTSPFNVIMDKMREQANKDMEINPEAEIGDYVANCDRRWVRDRDMKRTVLSNPMQRLAFVGLVDENRDMLKMACRMALSLAHHKYWCESIIGVFPGATWHHRSFTEEVISKACGVVLDWAGSMLTWHGRHIINDAIIQKGLPRIEADFKTVEYIRDMNQGIVFSSGRITALIALAHEYPRYEAWLKSAEEDLFEMMEKYILPDGGTMEGPGYWNYTFSNILPILYILAKYRGIPLSQYVPQSLHKTGEFALAMLSTADDGTKFLPVNDAHLQRYSPIVPAVFSQISDKPEWNSLYASIMKDFSGDVDKEFIIIADEPKKASGDILKEGFCHLPDIGQTYLYKTDLKDIESVRMQLVSGPNYFGHCHSDKGSFILEADRKQIIIDRGVCTYAIPYVALIGKADNHNLFMPQCSQNEILDQNNFNPGAAVTYADYAGGILAYTSDNTLAWNEGIYIKNYRRIFSPHPCVYLINDEASYVKPTASAFVINTKYDIRDCVIQSDIPCKIKPIGWQPVKTSSEAYGFDEDLESVNQLKLFTDKALNHNVITAVILGDYEFILDDIKTEIMQDGIKFTYKGLKYTAKQGRWE